MRRAQHHPHARRGMGSYRAEQCGTNLLRRVRSAMTVPTPRKPVHCLRHPTYWLASCADCRAAQHAELAKR